MLGLANGNKAIYGAIFLLGMIVIPQTITADTMATLTYTQYLDNQTNGYWAAIPSVPRAAPLAIPIGTAVTWTGTVDLSSQPAYAPVATPKWTVVSSNLPAGLTAVSPPAVVFWVPFTSAALVEGIAPGDFTWQGQNYLDAYTIQFPDCPVSSSCTASTIGQYYFPGYFTYASTTFDTLSISISPEPTTLFSLVVGLFLLCVLRYRVSQWRQRVSTS